MRFSEQVVAITGAAKGIGRAAALAFAREGAAVVLLDWAAETEAVAQEIAGEGLEALFVRVDVSSEADVRAAFETINARWGRLDVLVNNAGIYKQGDVLEVDTNDWDQVLAINLGGSFLCSKYAAPLMLANGGVIVNVASEAGLVGIQGQVAYNVSKAGMIALTRSCAVDLASRGIRVNSVCPGTTFTPLVEAAINRTPDPAAAKRHLEEIRPLNRLGKPEEIASAILYMASREAGYATGSVLSIDGGYTAQ